MCIACSCIKSYVYNSSFTEKLCVQLIVREKSIHTSILQTVVHTSCTYKLCAYQTYTQKLSDKILYLEVMHQCI
jgi:hypothetical protein